MDYHAHALLDLMEGRYFNDETLLAEIIERFGADATFHTCSVEGQSPEQIIAFLKGRNKFLDTPQGYTVNTVNRCGHSL